MSDGRLSGSQVRDVLRAIWAAKWAVVAGLAPTMAVAVGLTLMHDRPYRAEADMVIRQVPSDLTNANVDVNPQERLLHEIAVLEGTAVADRMRADLGLSGDVPAVTGHLGGANDVVAASVESPSAQLSASLVNAYIDAYIEVQSDQMTQDLTAAVATLETQLAGLLSQLSGLAQDDPQRTAILDKQSQTISALGLLQAELAAARVPAEVVQQAAVPANPIGPALLRPVLLSLVVGSLLAAIGVAVTRRPDQVRHAGDLTGLRSTEPVLAVVPPDGSRHAGPIVARQSAGSIVDAYTNLRTVVQRVISDRNVQVIQCCSPHDGDGATTTAVNLAVILARTGANVALVDLDLRNPRVHEMLGLDLAPGVTDALDEGRDDTDGIKALTRLDLFDRIGSDDPSGSLDRVLPPGGFHDDDDFANLGHLGDDSGPIERLELEQVSVFPPPVFLPIAYYDDLTVITAGTPAVHGALEVLSRRRLDDLMAQLRASYDIILIDSPAVLDGGEAVAIARHADGAVVVVRSGTVSLPVIRQTLGTVERAGPRILGLVLTGTAS